MSIFAQLDEFQNTENRRYSTIYTHNQTRNEDEDENKGVYLRCKRWMRSRSSSRRYSHDTKKSANANACHCWINSIIVRIVYVKDRRQKWICNWKNAACIRISLEFMNRFHFIWHFAPFLHFYTNSVGIFLSLSCTLLLARSHLIRTIALSHISFGAPKMTLAMLSI